MDTRNKRQDKPNRDEEKPVDKSEEEEGQDQISPAEGQEDLESAYYQAQPQSQPAPQGPLTGDDVSDGVGVAPPGMPTGMYPKSYRQYPTPASEPSHPTVDKLLGSFERLPGKGIVAVIDGLLKRPANVAYEIEHSPSMFYKLLAVLVVCMLVTGVVVGSFAGGLQLVVVPIKMAVGLLLAAFLCLPSLYILSCLSGSRLLLRDVFGAQMMGLTMIGILLLGFAPISWVFSQSTSSPVFMGVMYLAFFILSCTFGLKLMNRVITTRGGAPMRTAWLWNLVFVLVALQFSTTLRPLFGEFDGLELGDKKFFLEHWIEMTSPERTAPEQWTPPTNVP